MATKANGKAKANGKTPAPVKKAAPADAKAYAAKLAKEFGNCTVVRATVQKFPKLTRAETLALADELKIPRATASTQYQAVRHGGVTVEF
jgi:hypothetical protein